MMLESESKILDYTGIGIRIGITRYWNQNWNRNPGFWKTLELESALVESELESLVPESFTTLILSHFYTTSTHCSKLCYRQPWSRTRS